MRIVHLALLAVALLITACGGAQTVGAPTAADAVAGHIHGLGVDPADRSLYIATHNGLFRAADGETRPTLVGESRQDTMGFTVAGPATFLGSGHPGPGDDRPPLLGLIRSTDAGRTWETVSLGGEADFHVLRHAGERVYGINSADGLLYVSDDGGRTWDRRTPPGPVIDVIHDPEDPDRLVATGEDSLYVSRDAGRRWRPVSGAAPGLLAWPRPDSLYLVDGAGAVHLSTDAGRTWRPAGEVGGPPAAFVADGGDLYVATHANEVLSSADRGATWTPRAKL